MSGFSDPADANEIGVGAECFVGKKLGGGNMNFNLAKNAKRPIRVVTKCNNSKGSCQSQGEWAPLLVSRSLREAPAFFWLVRFSVLPSSRLIFGVRLVHRTVLFL